MTLLNWKLHLGGHARAMKSLWRPQQFRIEQITYETHTDTWLGLWLDQVRGRGTRYQAAWRRIEQRVARLLVAHPDRIAPQLARNYMGGVDTFEYIHVTHRGGRFLSALARQFTNPRVVEIGTAFGVSGMYLLSSVGAGHLWTFDPCDEWRAIATGNLSSVSPRFTRVSAAFEHSFPALARNIAPIRLAFVDGLHTQESMMGEFHMLEPHMPAGSVIVFHDVELDDQMRRAWREVKQHPRVRCSAFVENQFGVCELGEQEP